MSAGELYLGRVMHRRLRPRIHQLQYRIFSLLLDLDEIHHLDRTLRFFSRGRLNFLSFHDHDHGDGSATPLRDQVIANLRRAGISQVGKVRLLAMPRLLGFVFNPLSVYYCEHPEGGLAAILYEVHNTFGERHTYVLPVDDDSGEIRQDIAKRFHVSPFLPMDLHYFFRVKLPGDDLMVAMSVADDNGPILTAIHSARRRPLTDKAILRAVAAHPLMTLKVVAGILWEAAKLRAKGIAVNRHPGPPKSSVTVRTVRCPRRIRAA